ncbi:hypothetical protein GLYMA_16G222400v4 [Glycine max]|nr:hypothetical protein GLYMA_16G222400v4 [Glycine max]KAH1152469.1 hypothetical protein GYH30_045769 [Glycine max]
MRIIFLHVLCYLLMPRILKNCHGRRLLFQGSPFQLRLRVMHKKRNTKSLLNWEE